MRDLIKGFFTVVFIVIGIFGLGMAIYKLTINPASFDEYSGKYDAGILWLVCSIYYLFCGIGCLIGLRKDRLLRKPTIKMSNGPLLSLPKRLI